ncbi:MAG: hypothetical protein ACYYK0_01580 [Candidatus Eutrophobiaceae bacterium]
MPTGEALADDKMAMQWYRARPSRVCFHRAGDPSAEQECFRHDL